MLWKSLECSEALLQRFISCPDSDLYFMTVFTHLKLCYVFITLAKLIRFDLRLMNIDHLGATGRFSTPPQMSFVRETNFPHLAPKILEKFTALATDYLGPEGERDAMWDLAFVVMMLTSGYEKEAAEVQEAMSKSKTISRQLGLF